MCRNKLLALPGGRRMRRPRQSSLRNEMIVICIVMLIIAATVCWAPNECQDRSRHLTQLISFNPRVITASTVQPVAQDHVAGQQRGRAAQASPTPAHTRPQARMPSCPMGLTAWDRRWAGPSGVWSQRGSQSLLSRVQEESYMIHNLWSTPAHSPRSGCQPSQVQGLWETGLYPVAILVQGSCGGWHWAEPDLQEGPAHVPEAAAATAICGEWPLTPPRA